MAVSCLVDIAGHTVGQMASRKGGLSDGDRSRCPPWERSSSSRWIRCWKSRASLLWWTTTASPEHACDRHCSGNSTWASAALWRRPQRLSLCWLSVRRVYNRYEALGAYDRVRVVRRPATVNSLAGEETRDWLHRNSTTGVLSEV
jgi:hypothetical protein